MRKRGGFRSVVLSTSLASWFALFYVVRNNFYYIFMLRLTYYILYIISADLASHNIFHCMQNGEIEKKYGGAWKGLLPSFFITRELYFCSLSVLLTSANLILPKAGDRGGGDSRYWFNFSEIANVIDFRVTLNCRVNVLKLKTWQNFVSRSTTFWFSSSLHIPVRFHSNEVIRKKVSLQYMGNFALKKTSKWQTAPMLTMRIKTYNILHTEILLRSVCIPSSFRC